MKKFIALILALALVLSFASCAKKAEETTETTEDAVEETVFEGADVRFAVLSGPTGMGAVKLMQDSDNGDTVNTYTTSIVAANDEIVSGLTNGDYDIAAIATNVAANLYNKTSGKIQVIALNTLGVLHILENGDSVQSAADLKGKTIYAVGQGANPEFVLEYILTENGLTYCTDGTDSSADVQIVFTSADDLVPKMVSGEVDLCMLPVPAATSVLVQNADVRATLDITKEWDAVCTEGQLTMGCVVVRTEFAEENPEAVNAFLEEYAESVAYTNENIDEAAALCETYGIVPKAPIAKKAIPDAHIVCITGADIKTTIEPYYNVLFTAKPESIGGAIPDDQFYYAG